MTLMQRYLADESGGGTIEYGLLAAMIDCFVLSALQKIGLNLSGKFRVISNALS